MLTVVKVITCIAIYVALMLFVARFMGTNQLDKDD
jgi:uncharacterized membrane protein affecting hemolysin expression